MTEFIISIIVLVVGYFVYGGLMTRIFGADSKRPMPCDTKCDGVDYMPMPTWKVFLIQFLNIAGLGPIFGAIMGVMFGPAAFIWIVAGTIFAGAVHDYMSGMMSVRSGGRSLPELVGNELGSHVLVLMRFFSVVLLILVAAVFVITPANLLAGLTPERYNPIFWICVIFTYYMVATMLPIDKIIGRFYPLFGLVLLFMALGLLCVLLFGGVEIPVGMNEGFASRYADGSHLVFPMMFVSIACGAISGFHATQSPMMARCMKNERLAQPVFYGAMVTEGLVALIWAAAAIAYTGGYDQLHEYMGAHAGAGALVKDISMGWLGKVGGVLAVLGVIVAPITTGDTALRSARLITSDALGFDQKPIFKRLLISLPIFALTVAVMLIDFNVLWRYFAWTNQTFAMFTLWAISVYLGRNGKFYLVSLLPALFMTMVCVSYILYAPAPEGFGCPLWAAVTAAACVSLIFLVMFVRGITMIRKGKISRFSKDVDY